MAKPNNVIKKIKAPGTDISYEIIPEKLQDGSSEYVATLDTLTEDKTIQVSVSSSTDGDFAGLDSSGNLTDSGYSSADFIQSTDSEPGSPIPVDANTLEGHPASYFASADSVHNPTISIQKNESTVGSFTLNQSTNKTINITVPTQPSDIGAEPADSTILKEADIINNVTSTDTDKVLSANMGKELQDEINNLKAVGRYLSEWNCTTGLPSTNPTTDPYTYLTGDYYIIGVVSDTTNFKPDGSSYTKGVASTIIESGTPSVGDYYRYDGTNWTLVSNTQKTVSFLNIAGDPYENINLAAALNSKQDLLTEGTGIDISDENVISVVDGVYYEEITYTITPTLINATAASGNPTSIKVRESVNLVYNFDGVNYFCPTETPTITGATGTWVRNSDTQGILVLSNPTSDVSFTISGIAPYTITPTLVNATAASTNPTSILPWETATLVYNFDGTTYICPSTAPTITGATGTWTKDSNTQGTLVLSNPTANISFTISGLSVYTIAVTPENVTASSSNPTTMIQGSTATLTFTANTGYNLPEVVTVTGASYTWTQATGTLVLSNPTANVSINISGSAVIYNITATLTNAAAGSSNPTTIAYGGTATLTYTANTGYNLPYAITVSGASYIWTQSTGTLVLSNPIANVNIHIVAVEVKPYLTFKSTNAFILGCYNNGSAGFVTGWDGTMEYSTNKTTWSTWTGTSGALTAVLDSTDNNYYLYIRGTNNTYVTGQNSSIGWLTYKPDYSGFVSNMHVLGNIENLLDYQTVSNNGHPTMADRAFISLFNKNTGLVTPPALRATSLAEACYTQIFWGCTSLTTVPALPATTLALNCYYYMFSGCTSLYVSDTQTSAAPYAWRIPTTGTFTNVYSQDQYRMFYQCLGTRSSDDMTGANGESHTYYTQNTPIE